MQTLEFLAEAFQYPAPGRLEALLEGLKEIASAPVRKELELFLQQVGSLSLGEWEELYTRTLDMNPPAAPYIGFQIWGESYQRGIFLSQMNRALWEIAVDAAGELPDHLIPVLRYLAASPAPLPELTEILQPALKRMHAALHTADPHNPYTSLLEAVSLACAETGIKFPETAGAAQPAGRGEKAGRGGKGERI